jgi:glycine hydroxymethyltransferase
VPRETQSPFVTSGIRVGTPALTTRGMGAEEMARVAALIDRVIVAPDDERVLADVRADVRALAARFPLYPQPAAVRHAANGARDAAGEPAGTMAGAAV